MSDDHILKSVDLQEETIDSVLNSYRHFNRWRKEQPVLLYGDIEFIESPASILAFIREYQGERILVCFNFSEEEQAFSLDKTLAETLTSTLVGHKLAAANRFKNQLIFPAFGCFYSKL